VLITKVYPVNKAFNIRLASRIGGILPTYCTGIGLLFLAHQEDSYVREYLSGCDLTT